MSSETEDSDRALKPGPRSNLLHPEKKKKKKNAGEEAAGERGKESNGQRHTQRRKWWDRNIM